MLKKPSEKQRRKSKASAWRMFSEYIRTRDEFVCVMCGAKKSDGAIIQAGHVVPVGNSGNSILFLEDDVFAQCSKCNEFHSHRNNFSIYFNWFDAKFSREKREEIEFRKKKSKLLFVAMEKAFPSNDFQSVYDHYKNKMTWLEPDKPKASDLFF